MSTTAIVTRLRPGGSVVTASGAGRTARWDLSRRGLVVKKRGASVFVAWAGTCVEDEMRSEELRLVSLAPVCTCCACCGGVVLDDEWHREWSVEHKAWCALAGAQREPQFRLVWD